MDKEEQISQAAAGFVLALIDEGSSFISGFFAPNDMAY